MNWLHEGKEVVELADFPEGAFGFVYRVTNLINGKEYIGRKQIMSNRTLSPLKGTKKKRKVQKESDWKTYYGSHTEIKQLIKEGNQDKFRREIIQFAYSPKHLTYLETSYLFRCAVLEHPDLFYNDNILGKFFRKDIPKK